MADTYDLPIKAAGNSYIITADRKFFLRIIVDIFIE